MSLRQGVSGRSLSCTGLCCTRSLGYIPRSLLRVRHPSLHHSIRSADFPIQEIACAKDGSPNRKAPLEYLAFRWNLHDFVSWLFVISMVEGQGYRVAILVLGSWDAPSEYLKRLRALSGWWHRQEKNVYMGTPPLDYHRQSWHRRCFFYTLAVVWTTIGNALL